MYFKRGKREFLADYKSKDLYKYYKQKHPENPVGYNKFIEITKAYYDKLMPLIIENNLEFKLPCRLGHFRIRQYDYNIRLNSEGEVDKRHLRINYKKSKDLWSKLYPDVSFDEIKNIKDKPLVYHLNEHSDGKIYQFFWDKLVSNVPNQNFYNLKITGKWKNYLSRYSKVESPVYFN